MGHTYNDESVESILERKEEPLPIESDSSAKAPASVERFIKQMVVTLKAVLLYPPASSIPRENAQEAVELLAKVLRDSAEARFVVAKDALFFDNVPVHPGQVAFQSFARELYNRSLAEVRFHAGASADDIVRFLGIIRTPNYELAEAGGFENRLWDLGVDSITVRETSARIVDAGLAPDEDHTSSEEAAEDWPLDKAAIDEILAAAFKGRPRDQRMLVRVIQDPESVKQYLTESLHTRGLSAEQGIQAMQFNEMAHMAAQQPEEQRPALFRALAEAVEALDPELRREFVTEKLLPDARTDDAVASVVRQMDIDAVSKLLVEGLAEDSVSIDGLARAIRNLALISLSDRDEVLNSVGAAMRESGIPSETIDEVLEQAAPSKLIVGGEQTGPPTAAEEDSTIDSILKMIDMAPTSVAERFNDDPEFVQLQEESRRGLSDGDVARALVTLASVNSQGEQFDKIMTEIENTIDLLIEQGEYEVAADAAEALAEAQQTPELPADRLKRIQQVLVSLGDTEAMKSVTKAMRMFRTGSPEHASCKRLLDSLGQIAIDPLLEVLADEPDMSARKALVDIVSEMAGKHIDELSKRVGDGRWYVVRNVVAILGKTKSSAILPSLGRTLRHGDARVRRETVRALAGVHDRLADEMLIAALEDSDAQNVQLAARYLGTTRSRGAVAALLHAAQGEGRGNREIGPRVEAIEALGRIGAPEAVPVLESLAGKRSLIGSSRVRDLKSAAEAALQSIASRQQQEGGDVK